MDLSPEGILNYWDVVDRVGLIGLLLGQIGLGWYFLFKYTPVALDHWGEWNGVLKDIKKELYEGGDNG